MISHDGISNFSRPNSNLSKRSEIQELIVSISELTSGLTVKEKSPRRLEIKLSAESLLGFAVALRDRVGFEHLSAISCVDWLADNEFELVYHFWSYRHSCLLSAKIRVNRETATMKTLCHQWQSASFFERDIHEMFGVVFEGNPDQEKYILTDWNGPPPMRKDFSSRNFAHQHFHFKDYNPVWEDLVTGGYHGAKSSEEEKHG